MSARKSGWLGVKALLILAVMLSSTFYVGVSYGITLNGTWSGPWITEQYGNFTSGLRLPFLTAGRIPITGTGGLITSDADLTFTGGDTLTVTNVSATDVYASGEIYRTGTSLTDLLNTAATAGVNGTAIAPTSVSSNQFIFDSTPSEHSGSGVIASMIVGESVTIGQVLYMKSDGKLWLSDANATTTMPVVALALGSITANNSGNVLKTGFIRDDTWTWTIGGLIYASGTTGAMTQTAPNTSGDIVQLLGYAVTADIIYFNPCYVTVEIS